MIADHSATGRLWRVFLSGLSGPPTATANRFLISPTIEGRSHSAMVLRSSAPSFGWGPPAVRCWNRQRFCMKKPQVQLARIASRTPRVSGGAFSMAPASRISRSGSSPGRSPVSVRIRVAIARAASAQARSATAACSTPRSDSSAVFGLPSSSALSTAFQAAARGPAGASSAWASGMVMGSTPRKSAARVSKTGTVQSMPLTVRIRRTPTMRMARPSGTEQQTKRFTTTEVYGAGPVS